MLSQCGGDVEGGGVVDGGHANRTGAGDVVRKVVDEERLRRLPTKPRQCAQKNFGVGFITRS